MVHISSMRMQKNKKIEVYEPKQKENLHDPLVGANLLRQFFSVYCIAE